jgi:hypothetical protein
MGGYSRCECVLNPSKLEVGYQDFSGLDGFCVVVLHTGCVLGDVPACSDRLWIETPREVEVCFVLRGSF